MNNHLVIHTDPVPKPRMTRRDVLAKRPCVLRYRYYLDTLRDRFKRENYVMGNRIKIIFFLKMPKSWSKKKQNEYEETEHESKPDLDNLVKAVCELHHRDQEINLLFAYKIWSRVGQVQITNI